MKKNNCCKVCFGDTEFVHDFGNQPLGNGFLTEADFKSEYFFPMVLVYCQECKLLQLNDQPAPEQMFHGEYAFYSSTSKVMAEHFESFANSIIESGYLASADPFVVELGCNDGILLRHFAKKGISHLGIEPSVNVAEVANRHGVSTLSKFFDVAVANEIVDKYGKSDVFMAANVMCHIPNILAVFEGIELLLKDTGVLIFEDPYLGDVISKISYDQVYDEHVFVFSLFAVSKLLERVGMEIIRVFPQNTHGGSMRYVCAKIGKYPVHESVQNHLNTEKLLALDDLRSFKIFSDKIYKSRDALVKLLKELKESGYKVAGYGATSKSTTILNFCNIDSSLIEYISDTTPIKQGKFTPGMHIPVVPYEQFKSSPPDYAVLFAWNHAAEIINKEKSYVDKGGQWIVHVPTVRIL